MYLMYVDESGDPGLTNSPTRYFVLTGLVVHELRWQPYLDQLIAFRRRMRADYGLKLREELHASHMISRPGPLLRIKRHDRLAILRALAKELPTMQDVNLINIVVDKQGKPTGYDVFETAWKALIQRLENTISYHNFPGPANADERGMLFPDHTDDKKLWRLLRQMRRYNPVPSQLGSGYRNLTLTHVVEDPSFRASSESYFIQACDLAAFLLYQWIEPNQYMRSKGGKNYFLLLNPVLCKAASSSDPHGIVWL